jgi:YcaO cyclodehydratase, ATP-ad Mg2+-binding
VIDHQYSLNQLKKWILTTVKTYPENFKIFEISWPQDNGFHFHDYGVEIIVDGKKYQGNGTSRDPDTALCKAVSESYERFCVKYYELASSNGCAAHYDQPTALINAKLELIERDAFLCHFILGTGFLKLDQVVHKNLEAHSDIKIENYLLESKKYKIVLTRLILRKYSQIFGMGISSDLSESLFKAEIEALRQWSYYKDIQFDELGEAIDFEKIKFTSFDGHGDLALTKSYFDKTASLFDHAHSKKISFTDLDDSEFEFIHFDRPVLNEDHVFKSIPLCFAQAKHPKAQSLFIGQTINYINPLRFDLQKISEFNLCPHPFR